MEGTAPEGHRPLGVAHGGGHGLLVGAQHSEQGLLKRSIQHGEQQAGDHRAVKPEGRAAGHGIIIPFAQGPAHHAGGAHAEQVVHRVESQQQGGSQGDGGVFHRVVQHAHKVGVCQVVEHHHQGTEHRGDG